MATVVQVKFIAVWMTTNPKWWKKFDEFQHLQEKKQIGFC